MNKKSVKYLENVSFSSLSFAEKSEVKSLDTDNSQLFHRHHQVEIRLTLGYLNFLFIVSISGSVGS